jgi:threonine dehydrogenase-like Zn-dependent dehydrogenase
VQVDVTQVVFPRLNEVRTETARRTFELGPNDVLIRTLYSVVSAASEIAKIVGSQTVPLPFVPGNRAVGEVVAIGSAVTDVRVGDRIFSHTPHASYAVAQRVRLPLRDDVELRTSPLVGLAMVGMTAVRVGQVELGDRVAVIGLGQVGNLAAQLLREAGAEVIAIDRVGRRLELARACGIGQTIDGAATDVESAVMELTGGHGVDVVVEASGAPQAAELAARLTGKRGEGVVVLLGSPRADYETNLTPFLNQVHLWREGMVTLRGAHEWRYPLHRTPYQKHSMQRNGEVALRLMAEGKLRLDPLIERVYRPDQAAEAFAELMSGPNAPLGVLFDWTGVA